MPPFASQLTQTRWNVLLGGRDGGHPWRFAAFLSSLLAAFFLLALGLAGTASAAGLSGMSTALLPTKSAAAKPPVIRVAACPVQLQKLGLCPPKKPSQGAGAAGQSNRTPSAKNPGKVGKTTRPSTLLGKKPPRRPGTTNGNTTTSPSGGRRVVCINGVRIGSSCGCKNGGTLRRINSFTYSCTTSTAGTCPKGKKRIGKACIPVRPPSGSPSAGGATGGSGGSTSTGVTVVGCIGGRATGTTCVCPNGGKPRRIGRNRFTCVAGPCGKGLVRVLGKCVNIGPPGGGPSSGGSGQGGTGPGSTSDPDRCIGGRMRHGVCHCPRPYRAQSIGRRTWRCILPPCAAGTVRIGRLCLPLPAPDPTLPPPGSICPPDTHRLGKLCVPDARPDPGPPGPYCRPGWRLRNGRCVRKIGTACPDGTARQSGRCVRVPPTSFAGAPAPRPPRLAVAEDSAYEPDEVLVEIAGTASQQIAARLVQTYGLTTLSQMRIAALGSSLYRFRIPRGQTVETVVSAIAREPGVDASQPNWRYKLNGSPAALQHSIADARPPSATSTPAAPAAVQTQAARLPQYARDLIGAPNANTLSRGADILVAIIDTGLDEAHPELSGAVAGHFNAFPSQPFEPDTHATAIASIIAARQELAGIAPDARILTVQAFTPASGSVEGGAGTSYRVISGINWSLMKGARVINMSFAGPRMDDIVGKLITKYSSAGVVFVAAAGNGGPEAPPAYPAAHPDVIAVTAIDERKGLYDHANVGDYIDLAAPGVDVMAAANGGAYDFASGTSFAAAHVSGVIALMLARSPRMDRARALAGLAATADDLGPPGRDNRFGAGCINAHAALLGMAVETSGSPP